MGVCDCGKPTVWNDMVEPKPMTQDYRIENIYRIWDCKNGGAVTICEGDDAGEFVISHTECEVLVTVEQIPAIIDVLQRLKEQYERELKCKAVDCVENSRSGRPDPPF